MPLCSGETLILLHADEGPDLVALAPFARQISERFVLESVEGRATTYLQVTFYAQDASPLDGSESPMGRIDVQTLQFGQLVQRFSEKRAAAQPRRGGF